MSKIALITGANKGLGFETARQLGKKGITVLIASRNEEQGTVATQKLKEEGLDVHYLQLDVNNTSHLKVVKDYIESNYGKLDILVNNAGIIHKNESWGENTSETVSLDTLKSTFDTNFFSLINITQTLLPLLKKSEAGRIVNVSSILGSQNIHSDESSPWYSAKPFAYNASKVAVNSFTIHLAAALKDTNIKVNSAHPGWVKTNLGTDAAPMEIVDGAQTQVSLALAEETDFTGKFIHNGEEISW